MAARFSAFDLEMRFFISALVNFSSNAYSSVKVLREFIMSSQPVITRLNLIIETLKGVKYVES